VILNDDMDGKIVLRVGSFMWTSYYGCDITREKSKIELLSYALKWIEENIDLTKDTKK
jgi:hypothetical protein